MSASHEASFYPAEAVPRTCHSNSSRHIPETHCRNSARANPTECSRSFSATGPGYYGGNSRSIYTNPMPHMSRGNVRNSQMLNGLLDEIGARVSPSVVSESAVSSGASSAASSAVSSASSARSVMSDPSARVGARVRYQRSNMPPPLRVDSSQHPHPPHPHVSPNVAYDNRQMKSPLVSSNASVCSSRSGFSGYSGSSQPSPSLPSGFKLRCRSLRPGEPLPHGPGWFDMTKNFGGSVNSLKKALLASTVQFVPNSQGYYLRSARKSIERHRDVFYLLWQEEPEVSPRAEWEGLRSQTKYI